ICCASGVSPSPCACRPSGHFAVERPRCLPIPDTPAPPCGCPIASSGSTCRRATSIAGAEVQETTGRKAAAPGRRRSSGRAPTEHGVAMLAVLLAMTLVAALGMGLALLAGTERRVAAHFAAGLDALYAAEAAAGRAAVDLGAAGDWTPIVAGAVRS